MYKVAVHTMNVHNMLIYRPELHKLSCIQVPILKKDFDDQCVHA